MSCKVFEFDFVNVGLQACHRVIQHLLTLQMHSMKTDQQQSTDPYTCESTVRALLAAYSFKHFFNSVFVVLCNDASHLLSLIKHDKS